MEREKLIQNIQNLLAFELFCQKKFDESLSNFAQLKIGAYNFLFTA